MIDNTIKIKTDKFDGPLSLLLMLIQKEDLSIKDLDINDVTKMYLDYIHKMKEINFDVAGEYLYMAATLVLLKSKSCLSDEDVSDLMSELGEVGPSIKSRADLIARLEELARFQKLSKKLWDLPKQGHEIFCKPRINRKQVINSFLTHMDLQLLLNSMMDFIVKEKRKFKVVRRDRLSIKEKLQYLKKYLSKGDSRVFEDLLEDNENPSLDDVIITFISLLELARLSKLNVFQNEERGKIYVEVIESLKEFNVELADGFEPEDEVPHEEMDVGNLHLQNDQSNSEYRVQ